MVELPDEQIAELEQPQQEQSHSESRKHENLFHEATHTTAVSILDLSPFSENESNKKDSTRRSTTETRETQESAAIDKFSNFKVEQLLKPLLGPALIRNHHNNPGEFVFTAYYNDQGNAVLSLGNKNPLIYTAPDSLSNGGTNWNQIWTEFRTLVTEECRKELETIISDTLNHLKNLGFSCQVIEHRMHNTFDRISQSPELIDDIIPEIEIIAESADNTMQITHFPRSNTTIIRTAIETPASQKNGTTETFEIYNDKLSNNSLQLVADWNQILMTAKKNAREIQEHIAAGQQRSEQKIASLQAAIKQEEKHKEGLSIIQQRLADIALSLEITRQKGNSYEEPKN